MEFAVMTALLDTGFLLAVMDADDDLHEPCLTIFQQQPNLLLPDVVIPELAYLVLRELGHTVLAQFLRALAQGELSIVQSQADDLLRAADLLEQYADSKVDFVDCVIVAISERLNIQQVLTVDQRHFRLFRPRHCDAFDIAPSIY
jgi:uncharacterized protein